MDVKDKCYYIQTVNLHIPPFIAYYVNSGYIWSITKCSDGRHEVSLSEKKNSEPDIFKPIILGYSQLFETEQDAFRHIIKCYNEIVSSAFAAMRTAEDVLSEKLKNEYSGICKQV